MAYTIYAKLPEEIEKDFEEKLTKIYKKYGKFRKNKSNKFVNIPHLTIVAIGDNYSKNEKMIIGKELKNFNKFSLEIDDLIIWSDKEEGFSHIVLKMKKKEELQKMHEVLYNKIKSIINFHNFVLDNYSPHISLITSLNKKKINDAKIELNYFLKYKKIDIEKICVKYMDRINKAKDVSKFDLNFK